MQIRDTVNFFYIDHVPTTEIFKQFADNLKLTSDEVANSKPFLIV